MTDSARSALATRSTSPGTEAERPPCRGARRARRVVLMALRVAWFVARREVVEAAVSWGKENLPALLQHLSTW